MQFQVSSFTYFGHIVVAKFILTNPNLYTGIENVYGFTGDRDVPNVKNHLMLLTWFFAVQDGRGG